jgi:hypothetical protein
LNRGGGSQIAETEIKLTAKIKAKRDRKILELCGYDTKTLSDAEIAEGAEYVRRIRQCDRLPEALAGLLAWKERTQRN